MDEMEELRVQCGEIGWKWRCLNPRQEKKDQQAVALVLDLAKAFKRVSLPVVWAWATHFSFPNEDLAGASWVF